MEISVVFDAPIPLPLRATFPIFDKSPKQGEVAAAGLARSSSVVLNIARPEARPEHEDKQRADNRGADLRGAHPGRLTENVCSRETAGYGRTGQMPKQCTNNTHDTVQLLHTAGDTAATRGPYGTLPATLSEQHTQLQHRIAELE